MCKSGRSHTRSEKHTHKHHDYRGRTLDQYNITELRDIFLEMFRTTKTSVDNPMIQPSAIGQRRPFLVLEEGEPEGRRRQLHMVSEKVPRQANQTRRKRQR